ncbi:RNA-guided endonuclease InsQ/TnpB family protein [Nonomuraea sp. NPDC049400]|uniref:RNA-guided endonuclease InsQ/TnpB family protein n=1 Tax=Nonomuraea sp. NPDC049400 TaxID=3364352 RepID=UPI0037BD42E7
MLAGRRYRLEFDFGQVLIAEKVAGICRSVWNTALEQRREYRRRGAYIGYAQQCAQLAEAKQDFPWLAEAPAQVLQQILKDLDQACRRHGTWKIHWKSRARWKPSFRFPTPTHTPVEKLGRKWGRVFLPKFGWAKFRLSRPLGGRVKSVTICFDGRHWFVSFLIDDGLPEAAEHRLPGTEAGVDRGVVTAATTSEGEFFDRAHVTEHTVSACTPPGEGEPGSAFLSAKEAERYLRLQRRLARTQRGSKRRKKVVASLGKLMGRLRMRRADFNAQTAHRLTRDHATVVLEDLQVTNMTASARGTLERPGRNVAQKSGLNRAILNKGWYGLERALISKARYTGSVIVKVNPTHTSQTCSACTAVDPKSRESQAVFRCTTCGHVEHADVNAAKNIKNRKAAGLVVSGRGDLQAPAGSVKRQAPRSIARGAYPAPRAAA